MLMPGEEFGSIHLFVHTKAKSEQSLIEIMLLRHHFTADPIDFQRPSRRAISGKRSRTSSFADEMHIYFVDGGAFPIDFDANPNVEAQVLSSLGG